MYLTALFILLLAFAYSPSSTYSIQAGELSVCKSCAYKSISAALKMVQSADRIVVKGGYHRTDSPSGFLLIDRPISLIGEDYPVIDGGHKSHVIKISSNSVHIEGFSIINSGKSDTEDYAGIYVEQADHCSIRKNIMVNNTYGIYLAKSHDCLLEANLLAGREKREILAGNGLHLWYSNRAEIKGNLIYGHRDGLYFEFAEDLLVSGNYSRKNQRYGMHFMFSHNNKIYNNEFRQNPTGVALMYSRNLFINGNSFLESRGSAAYGLLLKEINDSSIASNKFSQNTVGIFMDTSNRNRIEKNNIVHNDWAMRVLGSSDSNSFTENSVRFNHFDVTTNSRENPNRYYRNYWSHYRGYDLNRDGLGDIPYRPVQIFSYWVSSYPTALLLLKAPLVYFLEFAERLFPVISPQKLLDREPLMSNPLSNPLNKSMNDPPSSPMNDPPNSPMNDPLNRPIENNVE